MWKSESRRVQRHSKFFVDELQRRKLCKPEIINKLGLSLTVEEREKMRELGFLRQEWFLAKLSSKIGGESSIRAITDAAVKRHLHQDRWISSYRPTRVARGAGATPPGFLLFHITKSLKNLNDAGCCPDGSRIVQITGTRHACLHMRAPRHRNLRRDRARDCGLSIQEHASSTVLLPVARAEAA